MPAVGSDKHCGVFGAVDTRTGYGEVNDARKNSEVQNLRTGVLRRTSAQGGLQLRPHLLSAMQRKGKEEEKTGRVAVVTVKHLTNRR